MNKALFFWTILGMSYSTGQAQSTRTSVPIRGDTTHIVKPAKISHAEPLYLDLVRDLGARKGEREWNVGTQLSRSGGGTTWHPFVEYEFAPVNRLGMEVELPFQLTIPVTNPEAPATTSFHLHSVKTSVQWTYAVIVPWQTSLAVGYTNELVVNAGGRQAGKPVFTTEEGHPFLVAAKKWGQRWHTLLYAALGEQLPQHGTLHSDGYELNLAFHYVIPRNKAFLGVELYQYQNGPQCDRLIRPQVRIALKNNLLVGLVGNIPLTGSEGPSSFIRLIYEPRRR